MACGEWFMGFYTVVVKRYCNERYKIYDRPSLISRVSLWRYHERYIKAVSVPRQLCMYMDPIVTCLCYGIPHPGCLYHCLPAHTMVKQNSQRLSLTHLPFIGLSQKTVHACTLGAGCAFCKHTYPTSVTMVTHWIAVTLQWNAWWSTCCHLLCYSSVEREQLTCNADRF